MENEISKVITILLAVILITVIPSLYINMFVDYINYDNKKNEIKVYMDKVLLTGKLKIKKEISNSNSNSSSNIYDEMILDPNFDITVITSKKIEDDIKQEEYYNQEEFEDIDNNKLDTHYTYTKSTLLGFDKDIINLKCGDIVSITSKINSEKTNIFLKRIFGIDSTYRYIHISGVVRNES